MELEVKMVKKDYWTWNNYNPINIQVLYASIIVLCGKFSVRYLKRKWCEIHKHIRSISNSCFSKRFSKTKYHCHIYCSKYPIFLQLNLPLCKTISPNCIIKVEKNTTATTRLPWVGRKNRCFIKPAPCLSFTRASRNYSIISTSFGNRTHTHTHSDVGSRVRECKFCFIKPFSAAVYSRPSSKIHTQRASKHCAIYYSSQFVASIVALPNKSYPFIPHHFDPSELRARSVRRSDAYVREQAAKTSVGFKSPSRGWEEGSRGEHNCHTKAGQR